MNPDQQPLRDDSKSHYKLLLLVPLLLSGCANFDIYQATSTVNQSAKDFTGGHLSLARTSGEQQRLDELAAELLKVPLNQDDAVRLALVGSPGVQSLLARHWSEASEIAQSGRIKNPKLALERMIFGDELEIGRALSFGLLDLLMLPSRQNIARESLIQAQVQLTSSVVDQVTQVRQAWVNAVAAQQKFKYARQVFESAQSSAELARRMQTVGNFSKLQRLRQQSFYATAATALALAQHDATAARESLIRLLGLHPNQVPMLKLPDRLPDIPEQPRSPEDVVQSTNQERLDIQQAKSAYKMALSAQGLGQVGSWLDLELGVRYDTVFDPGAHGSKNKKGYELEIELPIFDWGYQKRANLSAQSMAAAQNLEQVLRASGSQIRESYSAYRTAYDISKHYREEIIPLQQLISEENVLRYNGMLIGVFELMADAREQVNTVQAAISADQQFWLADASLRATMMGKPTPSAVSSSMIAPQSEKGGH